MRERNRPAWVIWCLIAYLVVAAIILFSPLSPAALIAAFTSWVRHDLGLTWMRPGFVEFGANVLLFVPMGFLVTLLFRRLWFGVLVSLLISATAELVQILLPARLASPRDVLANVLGGAIGGLLAVAVARRARSRLEALEPSGSAE